MAVVVSSYDNVKPLKTGATAIRRWGCGVVGREGVEGRGGGGGGGGEGGGVVEGRLYNIHIKIINSTLWLCAFITQCFL